jgi:hypothetical protein
MRSCRQYQAVFVTTSRPAIEPAISTRPVMNQLMANVSSVPNVRQLSALRTDLVCVCAPRKSTRSCSCLAPIENLSRRSVPLFHDRRLPTTFLLHSIWHDR